MHRDGGSLSIPDRSLPSFTYEIPPIGFLLLFSANEGNLLAVRSKTFFHSNFQVTASLLPPLLE